MDDLINRQAVLDMLEDINAETEGVGFYYEHYVDYIKSLPSVKPQERIGEWIEISRGFECDQCHGIDTDGLEPPYCKWCGTRMKGDI